MGNLLIYRLEQPQIYKVNNINTHKLKVITAPDAFITTPSASNRAY